MTATGDRRWSKVVDPGLQQERTALAWERTAIAMMVAGILLARFAAGSSHLAIALAGITETVVGAGLLVWSGVHYTDLRGPILEGSDVVHPAATRLVGSAVVVFSGFGLLLVLLEILA